MDGAPTSAPGSLHVCAHCAQAFTSKNKLFAHLKSGSNCTTKAGLKVVEPCEKVALIIGCANADEGWRAQLWEAIDMARDLERHPGRERYAACGGAPSAAFASDATQTLGLERGAARICDVLSLTTEVVSSDAERTVWCTRANAALPPDIRILGRSQGLPGDFNADLSCIRRYYNCLVPLPFLVTDAQRPNPELHGEGDGNCGSGTCNTCGRDARHVPREVFRTGSDDSKGQLNRLKELVHRFEGEHPFHNFATLLKLTPGESLARRSLFKFKGTTEIAEGIADMHAAGDALLPGQLRAMVGLTIAILRGLLPDDYLEAALGNESLLSVPSVPQGTICFSECVYSKKFHYMLQPIMDGPAAHAWRYRVRRSMAASLCSGAFEAWYRDEVVPAVPAMLAAHAAARALPSSLVVDFSIPELYAETLRLLREAEASGKWPGISTRREKVIKSSTLLEHGGSGGSFTVGSMPPPLYAPSGNLLFPELMFRAFELERALMPDRLPSSTIAINKKAQFLPHLDSGAGAGQGISMIVGLGDYSGGEIVVEGKPHDIRYKAIEFNGWTQRHWNLPFDGERFSLVWFTPLGCEGMPGLERCQLAATSTASSIAMQSGQDKSLTSGASYAGQRLRLASGLELPQLTFGTFQLGATGAFETTVATALEVGFRSFDTAALYKNEVELGAALRKWEEASLASKLHPLVTSKCPPSEMGFEKAQHACRASLERLNRTTLDLYLIHWPAVPKKPHASDEHRLVRHQTWRGLEKLYREGFVRAIGVSNFTAKHLAELIEDGVDVMPMLNQVEVHPFCVPDETIEFCAVHGIMIQAYSPLGGGPKSNAARASGVDGTQLLLGHPTVTSIAQECDRTSAQVLLRWGAQRGFALVARSSDAGRMAENFNGCDFVLSTDQMERLGGLRDDASAQKFCWDPSTVL